MIHDVSTDPDDAPPFVALLDLRLKCKNGVHYSGPRGAAHRQHYPDIVPVVVAQPPAKLFQTALAAAKALQWTIAAADESLGRIEATSTTPLMRFKDDVVIRIRANDSGSRLDIRSASRVGSSDFGTNAKRIRIFLTALSNHLKTHT